MIALILAAAGTGSRFGGPTPKQFTSLRGKPVYFHSLDRFAPLVAQSVLVVPSGWMEAAERQIASLPYYRKVKLCPGGESRQDSVQAGLTCLDAGIETVLVHDAARPFVSADLIRSVIEGARSHGACVPLLPLVDTLKEVQGSQIAGTLDRDRLRLAQTPQGFEANLLRRAFDQAARERFRATDESALVERLGVPVFGVPGEAANVKVTWKQDGAF